MMTPDTAAPPDLAPPASAVKGVVRDEAEAAVADVAVLACSARWCTYGRSAQDGAFFVGIPDEAADLVVKVPEDHERSPRRAEAVAPVHVPGGVAVDVGVLFVPTLPPGAALAPATSDPQTVAVGDGLVLTLRRGDLEAPIGADDSPIAARKVPLARVPRLPGVEPGQIVAVYALSPFSMKSRSKITVRAPSALPAGTAVSLRTLSELDGRLSPAEPGESDGAAVLTDTGGGIVNLTWLLITAAP